MSPQRTKSHDFSGKWLEGEVETRAFKARFQQKDVAYTEILSVFLTASQTNWCFFSEIKRASHIFIFHIFLIIDLPIQKKIFERIPREELNEPGPFVKTNGWVAESDKNPTSTTRLRSPRISGT